MTRYCIIGAGPAGLAALKAMLDSGHDVDCFEKCTRLRPDLVDAGTSRAACWLVEQSAEEVRA